jgi:hypothetical protein
MSGCSQDERLAITVYKPSLVPDLPITDIHEVALLTKKPGPRLT